MPVLYPTIARTSTVVKGDLGRQYQADLNNKLLRAGKGQWQPMRELLAVAAPVHYSASVPLARLYANNCLRITAVPRASGKKQSKVYPTWNKSSNIVAIDDGVYLASTSLDISGESRQHHVNSGGWGRLARKSTLTPLATRTIKECGQVLEDICPLGTLFLTGTLPGSTVDALQSIAAWSGWLGDRVMQWLRRLDTNGSFLYVWELQDRGALHIHIVAGFKDVTAYRRVLEDWHDVWVRCLYRLCEKSGLDVFQREQGGSHYWYPERVQAQSEYTQKSVSAYLSSYLKKCKDKCPAVNWFCPGRWWSASYGLLGKVREYRRVASGGRSSFNEALRIVHSVIQSVAPLAVLRHEVVNPFLKETVGEIMYFPRSLIPSVWQAVEAALSGYNAVLQANRVNQWSYQYDLTKCYSYQRKGAS